jgi:hypothetical protein
MILNLLEQRSISGCIEGEYLQGGIGEFGRWALCACWLPMKIHRGHADNQRIGGRPQPR